MNLTAYEITAGEYRRYVLTSMWRRLTFGKWLLIFVIAVTYFRLIDSYGDWQTVLIEAALSTLTAAAFIFILVGIQSGRQFASSIHLAPNKRIGWTDDRLVVENDFAKASYPFSEVRDWLETPNFIGVGFSPSFAVLFPKSVLGDNGTDALRKKLADVGAKEIPRRLF